MHLLYLDDSGSSKNADENHLVLGGVSLFEAQAHWITQEMDKLASTINPSDPNSVEFHASAIYARERTSLEQNEKGRGTGCNKGST